MTVTSQPNPAIPQPASPLPEDIIAGLEHAAIHAGLAILAARDDGISHSSKADGSPVSNADLVADALIAEDLHTLDASIPIISEETWTPAADQQLQASASPLYWCIDPLDGTRGFLNGGKHFTVNIALIEHRCPRLGVIFAPALGMLWAGDGRRAWRRQVDTKQHKAQLDAYRSAKADATVAFASSATPIRVRAVPLSQPKVITTLWRSPHPVLDDWVARIKPGEATSIGSSLKFCRLAEGEADLYPRIGTTMEWDTAAGQAILESAGGHVWDAQGTPLAYGKPNRTNSVFMALGGIDDLPSHLPRQWLPQKKP